MTTIPSVPTPYTEIKTAAESETCSPKSIGTIIAQDIGMTAKLLRLVNSAYFSLPKNVSTVEQAVNLLGLDTIQALVLSVHVFLEFPHDKAGSFHDVADLQEGMILAEDITSTKVRHPAEARENPQV